MTDRRTKTCPTCGAPLKLKRSRVRRLEAGMWKGKRYTERPNPNFNREYIGCTIRSCGYFSWTESQATGDPEVTASTPEKPVVALQPKAGAKGQVPEALTETLTEAQARRAQSVQASAIEAEARAEKLREAARGDNGTAATEAEIEATLAHLELREVAQETAKLGQAIAEGERIRLKQVAERRRVKQEREAAAEKVLAEAEAPMEVDAVRAMFAIPG